MKLVDQVTLRSVRRWFKKSVLGLNLCPFAKRPYHANKILFELSRGKNDEQCLSDLYLNLLRLDRQPEIETILLICPYHLTEFSHFNQFLSLAENLLELERWDGIYQIASFHPDYRFEGSDPQDRANWTNRSPYPVLHLLREESISSAVDAYKNIDDIPEQNIKTLRNLSDEEMQVIFGKGSFR